MNLYHILQTIVVSAIPILIAVISHEVAHGYAAYKLGDPTAKLSGRLTFNPLPHIDPVGTILIPVALIFFGSPVLFGWAKPVPINPSYLRRKNALLIVSVAGVAMNLVLAVASAIILKFVGILPLFLAAPLSSMLYYSIVINVVLMVFNLIPIPPLDGGHILEELLPIEQKIALMKIEPYGLIIIMILLFSGVLNGIIFPIVYSITQILTG